MQKIFFLVLIIIPSTVFSDEPDKILHEKCLYPTVIIASHTEGRTRERGTGVIVRSEKIDDSYFNVVATCQHVLTHADMAIKLPIFKDWSKFEKWEVFPCLKFAGHKDRDLGIVLFVSSEPMPTADWGMDEKLFMGTRIMKIACGNAEDPRLDWGYISSLNNIKHEHSGKIRTSITTVPGDSGGPVFCNYKIIGLAQSIKMVQGMPVTCISNAIPAPLFKEWNEEEKGRLAFVYDPESPLPILSFAIAKFESYEINNSVIPEHHWEN